TAIALSSRDPRLGYPAALCLTTFRKLPVLREIPHVAEPFSVATSHLWWTGAAANRSPTYSQHRQPPRSRHRGHALARQRHCGRCDSGEGQRLLRAEWPTMASVEREWSGADPYGPRATRNAAG